MIIPGAIHSESESLGGWCSIPSSLTAEVFARSGFDWVCIDTQHGMVGRADLVPMLQAVDAAGIPALVRVPSNDSAAISYALDAGASGVIVPMVNSGSEAKAAAAACRYAPLGDRSYGPSRASLRDPSFSPEKANRTVVCHVQIETAQAIAHLDDIASTPGIDGLFVGPADLALSIGTTAGSVVDENFRSATRDIAHAARENGLIPGMYCGSLDAVLTARQDGFTMLAVLSDLRFLRIAVADALLTLRPSLDSRMKEPARR